MSQHPAQKALERGEAAMTKLEKRLDEHKKREELREKQRLATSQLGSLGQALSKALKKNNGGRK